MLRCLQSQTGEKFQEVSLEKTISIGRNSSCNLLLGWDGISRQHCKIERFYKQASSAWRLSCSCDEKGNGTFVNMTRVKVHILKEGDVVSFGRGQELPQGSRIKPSALVYQFVFRTPKEGRTQPLTGEDEHTARPDPARRTKPAQITIRSAPVSLSSVKSHARRPTDTEDPTQELTRQTNANQSRTANQSEKKEQGVLTAEIGLVGCGVSGRGARKGPAVRGGRIHDLAFAGGHSAFGFVSEQLAAKQEERDRQWTAALVLHRSEVQAQAAADKLVKAREKAEQFVIRQLEAEKVQADRRRLEGKREEKRRELLAEGVPLHVLDRFFGAQHSA